MAESSMLKQGLSSYSSYHPGRLGPTLDETTAKLGGDVKAQYLLIEPNRTP